MWLRGHLRTRRRQPEIMDEADLDPRAHAQALRGLERINLWSGSARILWPPLRHLAGATSGRPLRILDIATGAGDVPIRLWHRAQRAGLAVELAGCDRSPMAVAYARQRAAEKKAAVAFFEYDALRDPFPGGHDVLMSSLFLHHLDEEQATNFLRCLGQTAGRLVLVNDLIRSWTGLALAQVGTRLLSASSIVHSDGPRSVEGAFTVDEVAGLAQRAGLRGFRVRRHWPCRFLLSWSRP